MKRNTTTTLFFVLLLLGFVSCEKDGRRTDAKKIVAEWVGKTILFPDSMTTTYLGQDTLYTPPATPFKVLVYTDSTGCTGCKAQFYKWNVIIDEINESLSDQVHLQFVFHPKDEKEFQFLLRRDNFKYPVYLDRHNRMQELNRFPDIANFQCFLLDQDNKVVLIGSPVLNPKIWELYKQAITGEEKEPQSVEETTVEVGQETILIDDLKLNQESMVNFTLKNTGKAPLFIADISSSCGCTVPEWDRQPIDPGKETQIKVRVTPDEVGFFNKVIRVTCNTQEPVIRLIVKGMVEE